ncbi:hypothetical protein LTR62_002370 [Meristemomyces frigidus]|uniref:Uncharacterized protein n=1 Tax=Meristemomyces frigidus TaxID=1508187 RepID=A0AAN7TJ91_9PEZI|nr:hypothetical protein LTR62_002370 [Meristemomyces frigidus]
MEIARDLEDAIIAKDAQGEDLLPASGDKLIAPSNYAHAKKHMLAALPPYPDEEGLDKFPLADAVENQLYRRFDAILKAWHPHMGVPRTVDDVTIIAHQCLDGRREQKDMQEHSSLQLADEISQPKQPAHASSGRSRAMSRNRKALGASMQVRGVKAMMTLYRE